MKRDVAERFWSHVDIRGPDECWPWKAHVNPNRYGYFMLETGRAVRAHKMAYTLTNGPVPPGKVLRHRCVGNRICCNPAHLRLGTQAQNLEEMREQGRDSPPPVRRGEANNKVTLADSEVRRVRELYATGEMTQTELADRTGMT